MGIAKQPAPGTESENQFLEEMSHVLAGWSDPAAHLREALQKDELQLYCQPILTLRSGRFEIAEVLVRLREGSPVGRFSINLSGQTLADRDFPGFVADELRAAGVPAGSLLCKVSASASRTRSKRLRRR